MRTAKENSAGMCALPNGHHGRDGYHGQDGHQGRDGHHGQDVYHRCYIHPLRTLSRNKLETKTGEPFLDALASLKTMFKIHSVTDVFNITKS